MTGKLVDCRKCNIFMSGTSCILYDNILNVNCGYCEHYIERKDMKTIEINVKINGKVAKLSDVSDETLANIKKSEEVKPIEHGDYGHYKGTPTTYRLFVLIDGVVKAYDKNGLEQHHNSNKHRGNYTITGNIFKDMKNAQ